MRAFLAKYPSRDQLNLQLAHDELVKCCSALGVEQIEDLRLSVRRGEGRLYFSLNRSSGAKPSFNGRSNRYGLVYFGGVHKEVRDIATFGLTETNLVIEHMGATTTLAVDIPHDPKPVQRRLTTTKRKGPVTVNASTKITAALHVAGQEFPLSVTLGEAMEINAKYGRR